MNRILRIHAQTAILSARPGDTAAARIFWGCGIVCGAGLALGAVLSGEDGLWWAQFGTLLFFGFAWLFQARDTKTYVDLERRVVQAPSAGVDIPFSELAAIVASARVELVRTRDQTIEQRRWTLSLLLSGEDAPLRATLKEARLEREAMLVRGTKPDASEPFASQQTKMEGRGFDAQNTAELRRRSEAHALPFHPVAER